MQQQVQQDLQAAIYSLKRTLKRTQEPRVCCKQYIRQQAASDLASLLPCIVHPQSRGLDCVQICELTLEHITALDFGLSRLLWTTHEAVAMMFSTPTPSRHWDGLMQMMRFVTRSVYYSYGQPPPGWYSIARMHSHSVHNMWQQAGGVRALQKDD